MPPKTAEPSKEIAGPPKPTAAPAKKTTAPPAAPPAQTTTPAVPATVPPTTGTSPAVKIAGAAVITTTVATQAAASVQSIVEMGNGYNIIKTPEGKLIKQEGNWNWRNNNPGNIEYGEYALSMGAIPFSPGQTKPNKPQERFAIFPTYEMGRRAKEKLIFEQAVSTHKAGPYSKLTIDAAIEKYAPPFDKNGKKENETGVYQKKVKDALRSVGVTDTMMAKKTMSEYTPAERNAILNAMEQMEGYGAGKKVSKVLEEPKTQPIPNNKGQSLNTGSIQGQDLKKEMNAQQEKMQSQQTINILSQPPVEQKVNLTKPKDSNPLLDKVRAG
jgi:hypothetical protein